MSKYFRIRGIEEDEIFRNLFIDYYPSLISFALYYVGDKTIAEDLVQEVFVKLWETRERWSAVGDFSAYVYQMVRFKCFNYLRAEKIRNEATRSFTEEVDITEINNYIAEETFRLVMNSMEDLPPACRTVFSLTLEGYSAKEIAEKLDIAVETVKKQKQIARKILKEKFGKLFLFLPAADDDSRPANQRALFHHPCPVPELGRLCCRGYPCRNQRGG